MPSPRTRAPLPMPLDPALNQVRCGIPAWPPGAQVYHAAWGQAGMPRHADQLYLWQHELPLESIRLLDAEAP